MKTADRLESLEMSKIRMLSAKVFELQAQGREMYISRLDSLIFQRQSTYARPVRRQLTKDTLHIPITVARPRSDRRYAISTKEKTGLNLTQFR